MPNIGLQQGIVVYKGEKLSLPSTLDMTHINALSAPKTGTDLGTLDLWAYKRKADVPFLTIAGIGSNNIIYEDNWLSYSVPAMRDGSTVITVDISGDSPGRGKTPFEIQAKGTHLSKGMSFKFDLQMKDEFMVQDYREEGEQTVYSVIRTDSEEAVNKMWLQPGNKILPLATFFSSEFGQEFADFEVDMSSGPKYKIPVGQMETQVNYHITSEVAKVNNMVIPSARKKAMDDAFEYYFSVPGLDDSGLTTVSDAMSAGKGEMITSGMKDGTVSVAISTLYDSLALKFLARGEQTYMTYGTGGTPVGFGGLDQKIAPVGAWQQLDTGYKTTFNIANFGLHTIEAAYEEYIHGKIDRPSAGSEPTIEIQTGLGGFKLMQRMIASMPNNQSLIVNAKDFGAISGSGPMNLEYSPTWYSSFRVPMLAIFKIVYNAAFDPIERNELTNPMVNGYPLSSYSMIIYPENEFGGSGNIKIVRSKQDGGRVFMNVINGRSVGHPLVTGTTSIGNGITVSPSSHLGSGYQATFTKKLDSLWVMDPTRILKLVPISPVTKKSF